ncbi:MAG: ABC transporter permease [Oscillospiraceae bacterium]|jgi:putative ABC transport system permease protein|nr:ABC transporter permease [Oscillospiraceae bacterium]
MFILRNAFKSISRSLGRNILIGIIVFAIATACGVALAIRTAAADARTVGEQNLSVTATVTQNTEKIRSALVSAGTSGQSDMSAAREAMRALEEKYPALTLAQNEELATDENVLETNYSLNTTLNTGDGILAVGATESADTTAQAPSFGGGGPGPQLIGGSSDGRSFSMGDVTVTGVSAEDAMVDFLSGSRAITDGTGLDFASDAYNVLVSKEFAANNMLKVGSTFALTNPNKETEIYTLTVVGIYENTSTATSQSTLRPQGMTAMDPANELFLSAAAVQKIAAASEKNATVDTTASTTTALSPGLSYTYSFADKAAYTAFAAAVGAKLGEYYTIASADAENYERSLEPLDTLGEYALKFLIVVLAIGAVVLIVINLFNIRERKYEVGVLTAIGIKKTKVAAQFVAELLIVTLLAVVLGAGAGAAISVPVSNELLARQVTSLQTEKAQQEQNFGRPGSPGAGGGPMMINGAGGGPGRVVSQAQTPVEYLAQINAAVNPLVLLQLIGLGLLLTLLSSGAAVVFVLRYEPLKILAERA